MTPLVEHVRYPLGGPCAVCGFPPTQLVIYPGWREVWHRPGFGRPCPVREPTCGRGSFGSESGDLR